MVADLLGPLFNVLLVVVAVIGYNWFGRYLPEIPLINEWPVRCMIWEVRGNGFFPKMDKGRNWKDKDKNDIFQLKKTKVETIPKKFKDAVRGIDGYNYLFLLQPSRTNIISLDAKIMMKGGDGVDEYLRLVLQEEKTLTWRKYALERNVVKAVMEPSFLQQNFPMMVAVFMVLAITIFVSVSAEPYVKLTDGANIVIANMNEALKQTQQLQETQLQLANRLEAISRALAGG